MARKSMKQEVTEMRRAAADVESRRWSPARIFLLVVAVAYVPLGIVGLIVDRSFPVGSAAAERAGSGLAFGIFETNGWHAVASLVIAVLAVYFTVDPRRARDAALAIGLFHVGITVSLMLWDPSTFWLASNAADQVVHASSAIGGIACGLLTRSPRAEAALSSS
ncbi:MAG: DUF4383 domain-containing protein [Actinomycetota bacterium]